MFVGPQLVWIAFHTSSSFPHTQVTQAFCVCAYTEKVRNVRQHAWKKLGRTVYLYACERTKVPCDEHHPLHLPSTSASEP